MTFRGHDITLGGHVSTAGGLWNAPARAGRFGFSTFQIFSKNQMQWNARPIPEEERKSFIARTAEMKMQKIMIHASYLLNLATSKEPQREKTLNGFREELRRADALQVEYLVIHPGSAGDSTEKQAIRNISAGIHDSIGENQKVQILLETAAGQGSNVGYTFEQLAEMIDGAGDKERVGVCFDTCHVYASGYDIRSPEGYRETMDRFSSTIGFVRLRGIHLNDSKGARGSRLDRHEQIGKGSLGIDGISNVINDPRLSNVPMCLETPLGEEGYDMDIEKILGALNR